MTPETLSGIHAQTVQTPRLRQQLLSSGAEDGIPVLFIHGNASSATFWEETMLALNGYRCLAPDLRGYGGTEPLRVDATRGFGDWVDDLLELKASLGLERYHVVGHSLGGTLLYSLMIADSANIISATFVAPGSPFGFGGTKDIYGSPGAPDYAGSGGGTVNPDFPRRIAQGDRSSDQPSSPRTVMNAFYWKPPFKPAREEALLTSLLSTRVGLEHYPGDSVPSMHWPGSAPGRFGPINALSPKYVGNTIRAFEGLEHKPPILWIRGADDQIVSDTSLFDLAVLGGMGLVPNYPGAEVLPPQPMIKQTRCVLDEYRGRGGSYKEVVLEDCGHTPYLEKPEAFMAALKEMLGA